MVKLEIGEVCDVNVWENKGLTGVYLNKATLPSDTHVFGFRTEDGCLSRRTHILDRNVIKIDGDFRGGKL